MSVITLYVTSPCPDQLWSVQLITNQGLWSALLRSVAINRPVQCGSATDEHADQQNCVHVLLTSFFFICHVNWLQFFVVSVGGKKMTFHLSYCVRLYTCRCHCWTYAALGGHRAQQWRCTEWKANLFLTHLEWLYNLHLNWWIKFNTCFYSQTSQVALLFCGNQGTTDL